MARPCNDPEQAIAAMRERFPFPGYTDYSTRAYRNVAETVQRYLPAGASILDVGCGPADKTAVLAYLGYACTGYDDLGDEWHGRDGSRERILDFARSAGIHYVVADGGPLPFARSSFDMVMAHDILEHLHDSPRALLNESIELLRTGGYLFITVPNAVNLRKRLDVLAGRTNLPDFTFYYWMPPPYRGHVREYVHGDLVALCRFTGLVERELRSCHHMLDRKRLPRPLRVAFEAATVLFPGWRDTLLLVAQKPPDWRRDPHPPRAAELDAIYDR